MLGYQTGLHDQLLHILGQVATERRFAEVGKPQFAAEARMVEPHRLFAVAIECKKWENGHDRISEYWLGRFIGSLQSVCCTPVTYYKFARLIT